MTTKPLLLAVTSMVAACNMTTCLPGRQAKLHRLATALKGAAYPITNSLSGGLLKLSLLAVTCMVAACNMTTKPTPQQVKLEGETMGTWYHITYIDSTEGNYKQQVDSVLQVINKSMSTYDPNSVISQFNKLDSMVYMGVDAHFDTVYSLALDVHNKTMGAFDPTVMPLVNAYGFGFEKMAEVDSVLIDSLLALVNFKSVELMYIVDPATGKDSVVIRKTQAGIQLDFSAIAKGYGVDAVGKLLEHRGVNHYMVEIGGEVRCRGKNLQGDAWRIGIDRPVELKQPGEQLDAILGLNNESMATSGNYRNYNEQNGRKFVHTINPKTGWPQASYTLSASVIAADCAVADAYATAFMVLGFEQGLKIAEMEPALEAYFIYTDSDGEILSTSTGGLHAKIEIVPHVIN